MKKLKTFIILSVLLLTASPAFASTKWGEFSAKHDQFKALYEHVQNKK